MTNDHVTSVNKEILLGGQQFGHSSWKRDCNNCCFFPGPCIFIVNEALLDNVIEKWTLVDDEWYLIRSREVGLNFQQNQIYKSYAFLESS